MPSSCFKDYVARTQHLVDSDGPVFVSLQKPITALAKVLSKAIQIVGLAECRYTAKCFRPTGATNAVENHQKPDFIRAVGRWKNAETFETHYVHAKPPVGFTDSVLNV